MGLDPVHSWLLFLFIFGNYLLSAVSELGAKETVTQSHSQGLFIHSTNVYVTAVPHAGSWRSRSG